MVYYGLLSRGCERCRKRKVKCDQRKPECSKCVKLGTQCPGYRDLGDVIFRDENRRIVGKSASVKSSNEISVKEGSSSTAAGVSSTSADNAVTLTPQLRQDTSELAAGFFFRKYCWDDPRTSNALQNWMVRSYHGMQPEALLRVVIEAVGFAGLANVAKAPQLSRISLQRYCMALLALNEALKDPSQLITDTTLMTVMLLCFFETINLDTWNRYGVWKAHVQGAGTLLELRGQKQLDSDRGAHLYMMVRSQMLLVCLDQHTFVPPSLIRISLLFAASDIRQRWEEQNVASKGSMAEVSFRIINLRAALDQGEIADARTIRRNVIAVKNDLDAWKSSVPKLWMYTEMPSLNPPGSNDFDGRTHIYPNLWIAAAWNNWRMLSILNHQLAIQNEMRLPVPDHTLEAISLSWIQRLSTDICVSVSSYGDSPRLLSLIHPLYTVCLESQIPRNVRCFAIEQLRRIGASMGVQQATLLAETASSMIRAESTMAESGSISS